MVIFGLFAFLAFICFVLAGISDFKLRKVSDWISSALWLLLFLAGSIYPNMFYTAVGVFALSFFANTIYMYHQKKILMGWADILVQPVYVSFLMQLLNPLHAMIVFFFSMMLPYIQAWIKLAVVEHKKLTWHILTTTKTDDVPLVMYMAIGYSVAFFGYVL